MLLHIWPQTSLMEGLTTKIFENKVPLKTTLDENETRLIENRPTTSALDLINENRHFFGLSLECSEKNRSFCRTGCGFQEPTESFNWLPE
jgi:hypothetical protein